MLYKVTRNTMINGKIAFENEVIDLEDSEVTRGLISDGNIVEASKADKEAGHVPAEDPNAQTTADEGGTANSVPFPQGSQEAGSAPSPSDVAKAAGLENNPPSSLSNEPPLNIQ